MADYRITLQMEGYASDDGHVTLAVFQRQVEAFASAISRADTLASGGKRSVRARVVDLTHSSPAAVTVEILPMKPDVDIRANVLGAFGSLNALDTLGDRSRPLLSAISKLSEPVGRRISSAKLTVGEETIELSQELRHRIEAILEAEESAWGSVDGRLEAINVHDGANVFYIYPVIGPTRVKCLFPSEVRETAVAAVDREARVSGTLKYKAYAQHPYEIEVEELEPLPFEDELPTLASLRGISPDATGGLPSEKFVRQLRDGWG